MGLRGKNSRAKGETAETPGEPPVPVKDWSAKGLSRAERVIRFVESLPITSGKYAGKPFKLRQWQKRELRAIYATDRRQRRPVRTAVLSMARKNGKTQLAAALTLCHLCGPESEERGQCYSAAADRDQAGLIFNELEAIITRTPWLDERLNVKRWPKEVEDLLNGSFYKALSSDANTKLGFSASFIVADEVAAWPKRALWDVLTTSTGAREEPLTIAISTQAPNDHHLFSELLDYGLAVRRGEIDDPSFYASLYAAPQDADLEDEAAWGAANPALGDFRSLEELRTAVQQAKRVPTKAPAVRNLYLNQRVSADPDFIPPEEWQACEGEPVPDGPCFGGLDLGSTRDLTAFALFWPYTGGLKVWAWVPKDNLPRREDEDRVPYRTWAERGLIEPTPGAATDRRYVALRIAQICAEYEPQGIAFDRWRMDEMHRILAEENIELPLQEFGQGFKDMGPAVRAFEERIYSRQLTHHENPLLTWALSNCVPNTDPAGNVKLDKERARERIDPIISAVMAIGIAEKEPEKRPYDFDREMVLHF